MSRELGIFRRRTIAGTERDLLKTIIEVELKTTPKTCGYRSMWLKLRRKHHLSVSRNIVMEIMRELAPDDVSFRTKPSIRRREYSVPGPNYLWHIDGYDKLKKFGFAIHGCIDGYSRKIMWLKVGPTNNNPKVVGKYFLDTVRNLEGTPNIIRADRGTENIVVERLQASLRSSLHEDSFYNRSFLYGQSCLNQRIERFWGSLREGCMQYVMDFLAGMERKQDFCTTDVAYIEAVHYCFMDVIRRMLDQFIDHWNFHRIRSSKGNSVYGKSAILFASADHNYFHSVDQQSFDACEGYVIEVEDIDSDFVEAADVILENWQEPRHLSLDSEFTYAASKLKLLSKIDTVIT